MGSKILKHRLEAGARPQVKRVRCLICLYLPALAAAGADGGALICKVNVTYYDSDVSSSSSLAIMFADVAEKMTSIYNENLGAASRISSDARARL